MPKPKADSVRNYQPFRYPGGKTKLAANPAFRALLFPLVESHDTFYEGFVGSASITLAVALEYPDKKLVVTDKDATIAGFWELIANGTDDQIKALETLILEFAALPVVRQNKKAFRLPDDPKRKSTDPAYEKPNLTKTEYFRELKARGQAAEEGTPLTLVERAYHALFFNRTTFSGIAKSQPIGGFNQTSEWTIDCRYNAELLVTKLHNLRRLLKGRLTVHREDIWDWLDHIPENVPLYLDPPYYVKGEALYPVAMENFEHVRLAGALAARRNWIMSYDICPKITEYYKEQKTLKIPFRYSINGTKKIWKDDEEYLICAPDIDTMAFEEALVGWKNEVEAKAVIKMEPGDGNEHSDNE